MSSDEDPSFPFICEGASGVLGIFGEAPGGLPDMSTGTGVADLEDVFAKATASLPVEASPQSGCEEKTAAGKGSASDDVLSDFQVESAVLVSSTEESDKGMATVEPSVLESSVELVEEIHNVLGDPGPALVSESSVLVPNESSKTVERSTIPAVAGSVELAEEIMEVFANSKAVLDSENSVSKLDSCPEVLLNDTCSLQEELDSLEQLAMERVREIEGELVNSSKQITDSHLGLNIPNHSKSNEISEEVQKSNANETTPPLGTAGSDSAGTHDDELQKDKRSVSLKDDLSGTASGVTPIVEKLNTGVKEESQNLLTAVENCESLKDVKSVQEDISSDILMETEKLDSFVGNLKVKSEHGNEISKLKDSKVIQGKSTNEKRNNEETDGGVLSTKAGEGIQSSFVSKNDSETGKDLQNAECSRIDSGDKNVYDKTSVNASEMSNLETDDKMKNTASAANEPCTKQIDDIQNYETEDDDLEVLEAFIVKSATNPELVMCAAQTTKDNAALKYSLESSLIDDLTKTDNDNGVNEGQDAGLVDAATSFKDKSPSTDSSSNDVSPQVRLSQALERASQNIASVLSDAEMQPKMKGSIVGRRPTKQKNSFSNGKQLPLKKRLSQRPIDIELGDNTSGEHALKGTTEKSLEKKVVVELVVKRRGRPPGSGKKSLADRKSIGAKSKNNINQTTSVSATVEERSSDDNIKKHPPSSSFGKSTKILKESKETTDLAVIVVKDTKIKEPSTLPRKSMAGQRKTEKTVSSNVRAFVKDERKLKESLPSSSSPSSVPETSIRKGSNSVNSMKRKLESKEVSWTSKRRTASEKRNMENDVPTSLPILKTSTREKRKTKDETCVNVPVKKIDDGNDERKVIGNVSPRATRSTKRPGNIPKILFSKANEHEKHNFDKKLPKSSSTSDSTNVKQQATGSIHNLIPAQNSRNDATHMKIAEHILSKSIKVGKRKVEEIPQKTTKRSRIESEGIENMIDVATGGNMENHDESEIATRNSERVPNIYSDISYFEFEEITFDMLKSKAKQLVLPTPLWGAQIDTDKNVVIFSRVSAHLSDDTPLIDKALVFQASLKPVALIMNKPVDLPIPFIRTFEDVAVLIRNFHSVSFCEGTGIKQRPQSKYCFRYLDVANPGSRCSQCLEERRRVLFGFARKLRERLRLLQAGMSL